MNIKINKNFKIEADRKIGYIKSHYFVLKHKSGTQIHYIKNKDKERFFAIEFVTGASNDKGLPHITEHSVLMGSEKYPLKQSDLFAVLLRRRQLNQINASTYPDKTNYYFSALNNNDFINTMDVYLDSVFNPQAMKNKNVLRQEGWRIDKDANGKFKFNGVVLNEMMSSFASPFRVLEIATLKNMLSKSPFYTYESGGDPNKIVDLTYKEFKAFYKKYYNTKNAKIFIYGDIKESQVFEKIDEFLQNANKGKAYKIKHGKTKDVKRATVTIKGAPEDSLSTFALYGAEITDIKTNVILNLIVQVLTEFETSPLRKILKSANVAKDVSFYYDGELPISLFEIYFEHIEPKNFRKVEKLCKDAFAEISKTGLDKERIKSVLKQYKLSIERKAFLTGLGSVIYKNISQLWNYTSGLVETAFLPELLKEIEDDFKKDSEVFDKYFDRYFAKANNYGVFFAKAKSNFDFYKELKKKEKALSKLSKKEIQKTEKDIKEYKDFKSTEDDLSVIVPTKRRELENAKGKKPLAKYYKKRGVDVFFDKNKTNLARATLVFNLPKMTLEELQRMQVLFSAIKRFNSKDKTREEIDTAISSVSSVFNASIKVSNNKKTKALVTPVFVFEGEVENASHVAELAALHFKELQIDASVLQDVLKEFISNLQSGMRSWHSMVGIAVGYGASKLSFASYLNDVISGVRFLDFLKNEVKRSKKQLERDYSSVYKKLSKFQLMGVSVFGKYDFSNEFVDALSFLPRVSKVKTNNKFSFKKDDTSEFFKNEFLGGAQNILAFQGSSKDFFKSMLVGNLLNMGSLWHKVRVEGGAYGARFAHAGIYSGVYVFSSYNDSHIKRTYNVFESVFEDKEYLNEDIEGALSRTLMYFDAPESRLNIAEKELGLKIDGVSFSSLNKQRALLAKINKKGIEKAFNDFKGAVNKTAVRTTFAPNIKTADKKLFNKFRKL